MILHAYRSAEAIGLEGRQHSLAVFGCSVRQAHHHSQAVPHKKDEQRLLDFPQDHGPGEEPQSSAVHLPSRAQVMSESLCESFLCDLFDLQCICAPCLSPSICTGMQGHGRELSHHSTIVMP